ncbi:protein-tyrosine-phosphatase [Psychrobacter sp. YP14]|uniref:protein-tyrosine-phosphatase n=1 Tax=Psychrobacter sanguinis TaxID=861445 RepID=A0A844LZD2_9GAMM|nr:MULTISPECIES: low molecular weight protein-tyrosine-phosphatase [Psychrobacter]AWT48753.1 protein-tyrosine-phosphatase [Psychrobacter sp. YP14]MUG32032.1 low molecular weight phosphotyrosine protein phosphatase [Psychrobacter sanguinis]
MPMSDAMPKSVLLVCLGNICRSPTAEGIMRQRTAIAGLTMKIDSAGTGDWHIGKHPDPRAQLHAKQHGYNISKLVARQVSPQDFIDFDLILAMDAQNLKDLQAIKDQVSQSAPTTKLAELALMSEVDISYLKQDVPDPYYGGKEGFEEVIKRLESSVDAWIVSWQM